MKTLIGIPCMDKIDTLFAVSLMQMRRVGETHTDIKRGSLIYDARNEIAIDAITNEADYVLWLDSDMKFDADLMERLTEHMENGCDMVTGLYFKRTYPTEPVISRTLMPPELIDDTMVKRITVYDDYPQNALFPVQGCGFGAVMMKTELIRAVWDKFGPPFHPYPWCGEDYAFCYRVNQLGRTIWCDSRIKLGHVGQAVYGEETWLNQKRKSE